MPTVFLIHAGCKYFCAVCFGCGGRYTRWTSDPKEAQEYATPQAAKDAIREHDLGSDSRVVPYRRRREAKTPSRYRRF